MGAWEGVQQPGAKIPAPSRPGRRLFPGGALLCPPSLWGPESAPRAPSWQAFPGWVRPGTRTWISNKGGSSAPFTIVCFFHSLLGSFPHLVLRSFSHFSTAWLPQATGATLSKHGFV